MFINKFKNITKTNNSYVCVGLDTDITKLPQCVKQEKHPSLIFNKRIIDKTYKFVAAYKPNFAFYLSQGLEGIEALMSTMEYIPKEIPIIIDIKAGDIGNTMEQYATAMFNSFNADAITINILMGRDVIDACLKNKNSFAFALALTSNKSATDFLHSPKSTNPPLFNSMAHLINEIGYERLGAVVGATQTEQLSIMREIMPEAIFLIPGIGTQGGDLQAVCKYARYKPDDARFLINSSRGIIFADSSENFATTAGKETEKLRNEINDQLS